jgi:hypothetical protein
MASRRPIDDILIKLQKYISDHGGDKALTVSVEKLVRKVRLDSVGEFNKGFCMRFNIPTNEVLAVFDAVDSFGREEINSAFISQWEIPSGTHMYSDQYYHNLLLLINYGMIAKNEPLTKAAQTLMMIKLWNGRSIGSIRWCDPDVMQYVTSQMMNRKSLPHKHPNPFEMIINHFVPTILTKYTSYVVRDSSQTKTLFNQSFNRLRQLFRSDSIPDPASGKPRYRSGLQPLYFKAKEQGLKFSTMRANPTDGEGPAVGDMLSSSGFDEQIENVTNYIIMNISPNYDKDFLEFVNKESTIKLASIEKIIKSLHSHKYADHVREVVELTFSRLSDTGKSKFCSPNFLTDIIKKRIISSKHTRDVIQLKKIIDDLLVEILDDQFESHQKYKVWSNTQKSQWRRVIIYAIGYNIQKQICFN